MTSESPSNTRSRTRSRTPEFAKRSAARSISRETPRSGSRRTASPIRPGSRSRSPEHRSGNGFRGRTQTRSLSRDHSRSLSPNRNERRTYRERSYSRSLSRDPIQSSKIVVEKLTKNVTEAHLREIFGTYGKIQSVDLPLNRQFMTNRGTAYIVYDHPTSSESAIAHMHEAQLDGAVITVSIVLPRRAFSRSPPPAKAERGIGGQGARGPPPRGNAGRGFRSPPRRARYGGGRRDDYEGLDGGGRRGYSRSASPPQRRRRSHSHSRSPSRTPPRRWAEGRRSPPRRRRRSPSYSSYSSYSRSKSRTRSPSRSRSPSRTRSRYSGRR